MFGAIAGGIASALAGGAMSKLFGGGQKAASGGIQGDVLATDNNTVGMGDAGIKSAIQGSNVPNPDEAVPSFVSGAMAKAGEGLLEGTSPAGTSAVPAQSLGLVGLGGRWIGRAWCRGRAEAAGGGGWGGPSERRGGGAEARAQA